MTMYDPRIIREAIEKFGSDLVDQLELYVKQQAFTQPGFYSAIKGSTMPQGLMDAITGLSELLKIKHCHQDYYDMVNRKITELLNPYMCAYQPGLAYEVDALLIGKERDTRTKVIRSKKWREKVRGRFGRDESDESSTDIE